jgi:predicted dehydrogenase
MVVLDDMNLTEPLRIYHKSVAVEREPVYSDSFGALRMQVRNGDIIVPNMAGTEPLTAECNHFVDCILGRAVSLNVAASALRVLRVLEAADHSMREDSAVVGSVVAEWRPVLVH